MEMWNPILAPSGPLKASGIDKDAGVVWSAGADV